MKELSFFLGEGREEKELSGRKLPLKERKQSLSWTGIGWPCGRSHWKGHYLGWGWGDGAVAGWQASLKPLRV